MPPKLETPVTATKAKAPPDAFQSARSIYRARKRLFDKAAALLDDADEHIRSLVDAHEEADAAKVIDVTPSSPEAATTNQ